MRIAISDDYQDAVRHLDAFRELAGHDVRIFNDTTRDIDELAARFQDAEALVLIRERTAISEELLARLPNLKLISQTGRGTSHIDLDACTRHGVLVCAGGGSPWAPAELTWALLLAAARRIPEETENARAGRWQRTIGTGLRGRTLGVFGYGKIGSIVAAYGRAFHMNVLVWGREGSQTRAGADGFAVATSREDFFERADFLSLHLRLTKETRHSVTTDDLSRMKPTAILVNTSRAELIEPGALVTALRAGRPAAAAVDVYEQEPLPPDDPLLSLPNAICTPHLGYVEKDSYERYFSEAFEQVTAFANGTPINVVNPK